MDSTTIESTAKFATTYQHTTLRDPATYIRLLSPTPCKESEKRDSLSFNIVTVRLKRPPLYNAISYTWGDATNMKFIYINGYELQIRSNCYYALWQSCLHYPDQLLWIDSISINQGDIVEKNAQVRIMGDIYAAAKRVLSCVGEHVDDSEMLVDLAKDLEAQGLMYEKMSHAVCGDLWKSMIVPRGDAYIERLVDSYVAFCWRTYWRRIWIVQEVTKASELHLLCGQERIPWSTFRVVDWIFSSAGSTGLLQSFPRLNSSIETDNIKRMPLFRVGSCSREGGVDLDTILLQYWDFGCSDPRDRIYGLLQVTSRWFSWKEMKQTSRPIQPDYTKATFDLACELKPYTHQDHTADLLRALGITAQDSKMQDAVRCRIGLSQHDQSANKFRGKPVQKSHRTVARIYLDENSRLIAGLSRDRRNKTIIPDYTKSEQVLQLYHSGTPDDMETFQLLNDRSPKLIMAGSDVAALACHETQPGDLLLCWERPHWQKYKEQPYLVLRHIEEKLFLIVGQAITLNGYQCGGGAKPWAFACEWEVDMDDEDDIVMSGMDLGKGGDQVNHEYDPQARLRRLFTYPRVAKRAYARLAYKSQMDLRVSGPLPPPGVSSILDYLCRSRDGPGVWASAPLRGFDQGEVQD